MQLTSRPIHSSCTCSRPQRASRPQQLHIAATAVPTSISSYLPPSPSSLDRPACGGSRSFDLPPSSDMSHYSPRSDLLRPSGGANRGPSFFSAASSDSSIGRPGGRGDRSDLPAGWDAPTPQDPAQARPGGRAGRDLGLDSSSSGSSGQDPALQRPGGRGGRDMDFSGSDAAGTPVAPISLDRPGGRGGRGESVGGGDEGSSGGSGSGGSGGSGGGDSGSGSSGDGAGGFNLGKGVGSVALYAGVIAAAYAGHQAFFAKPAAPAAPEPKPCCAGKGKKK